MSDQASALNAMRMIDLLIEFYGPDGEHWLQYNFHEGRKRRCLVDAIAYLRRKNRISGDNASWYIYEVSRPRELPAPARSLCSEAYLRDRLMTFNDARCGSFAELRAVLIKARIRAAREFVRAAAQTDRRTASGDSSGQSRCRAKGGGSSGAQAAIARRACARAHGAPRSRRQTKNLYSHSTRAAHRAAEARGLACRSAMS